MDRATLFQSRFGLAVKVARDAAANATLSQDLVGAFETAAPGSTRDAAVPPERAAHLTRIGPLVYMVLTAWPREAAASSRTVIEAMIGSGELDTSVRVKEALAASREAGATGVTRDALRQRCGVGVVQGPDVVDREIAALLTAHRAELLEGRYPASHKLRRDIGNVLKWADGKDVATKWDAAILALLGPKDSEQNRKEAAPKKEAAAPAAAGKKGAAQPAAAAATAAAAQANISGQLQEGELGLVAGMDRFGAPQDNKQLDDKLLQEHLKATGGKVVTRFPPEPNGYLHLGHALSMARVFGYAEAKGGSCILRFDDTNPESEKQEYIDSIKNDVAWMGYRPIMTTYASDHFERLYTFAEQLIRQNQAYVCHLPMDAMRQGRKDGVDSPYRNRSVEENLALFRAMREGRMAEGECTLRVKGNMQHLNPNMRDFVAYRIKFMPHPHAGDKWCIYPSYDYTHAICDSLENITHSICTLEFTSRNETYQWLLNALHIYRPPQLEAQRLQLSHTVLSKRKLIQLVRDGYVSGWGDARMPTLMGARRKGYAPRALHDFCLGMGISRSADGVIPIERLDEAMRSFYNTRAPRAMALRVPLAVVVDNWTGADEALAAVPDFPDEPTRGSHSRVFGRHLFIDRRDWREVDSAQFFGLAPTPGKRVRFKYAHVVRFVSAERDAAGNTTCVHVEYERDSTAKVKGTITWLAKADAVPCELRMLKQLFKSPTPGVVQTPEGPVKKNFLEDLHPNSMKPIHGAMVERRCHGAPVGTTFQFERIGYFTVDPDSTPQKTVFNRTVTSKATKVKF